MLRALAASREPEAGIVPALRGLGSDAVSQIGSHLRLGHGPTRVTVPAHSPILPGPLKPILRQAEIALEERLAAL